VTKFDRAPEKQPDEVSDDLCQLKGDDASSVVKMASGGLLPSGCVLGRGKTYKVKIFSRFHALSVGKNPAARLLFSQFVTFLTTLNTASLPSSPPIHALVDTQSPGPPP